MAALSSDDVRKVARLASLELSDTEIVEISEHLGGILEYVDVLNQVDTDQIEPLAHPIEVVNVFREDVSTEMLSREDALKNAPRTDGKYFVVPAILNAGE